MYVVRLSLDPILMFFIAGGAVLAAANFFFSIKKR